MSELLCGYLFTVWNHDIFTHMAGKYIKDSLQILWENLLKPVHRCFVEFKSHQGTDIIHVFHFLFHADIESPHAGAVC